MLTRVLDKRWPRWRDDLELLGFIGPIVLIWVFWAALTGLVLVACGFTHLPQPTLTIFTIGAMVVGANKMLPLTFDFLSSLKWWVKGRIKI